GLRATVVVRGIRGIAAEEVPIELHIAVVLALFCDEHHSVEHLPLLGRQGSSELAQLPYKCLALRCLDHTASLLPILLPSIARRTLNDRITKILRWRINSQSPEIRAPLGHSSNRGWPRPGGQNERLVVRHAPVEWSAGNGHAWEYEVHPHPP